MGALIRRERSRNLSKAAARMAGKQACSGPEDADALDGSDVLKV
jgi:hypothetical protein